MDRKTKIFLCRWLRPHHFIVLLVAAIILSLFTAYGIAVSNDHVNPLFPYISDAGTRSPASCIFGLFLNLAGFLAITNMYIWHNMFENYSGLDSVCAHVWNDIGFGLGILSSFGLVLVGNFQVTNVVSVHMLGAIVCFGCGNVYCWIATYLSKLAISTGFTRLYAAWARAILALGSTAFFVATFAAAAIGNAQFTSSKNHTRFEWSAEDGGYSAHLVSTFSEWLMVICFTFYFLSFYPEFRRAGCTVRVLYHGKSDGELVRIAEGSQHVVYS